MIVEATDFKARFDAVRFIFDSIRPDLDQDRRDDIALTYALNEPFSAIEEEDYSTSPRRRIVSGKQHAPIWTYMQDGVLVGALMCSCRSELYPTRVQGIAVRRSHWGTGVSTELIGTTVDEERILGGAPRDHNARRMCERVGLAHWVTGASGATLCFSEPIRSREALKYVVPAAGPIELGEGRRRLLALA